MLFDILQLQGSLAQTHCVIPEGIRFPIISSSPEAGVIIFTRIRSPAGFGPLPVATATRQFFVAIVMEMVFN
jgi:hypothetical protein